MPPEDSNHSPSTASGLVVAVQANYCWVQLERPGPCGITRLLCTRRTRLAKRGLRTCVGDSVEVEGIDWRSGRGAVAALAPRRCSLGRPAVANVDRVVVVVSLAAPALDPLQLTRFLVTAEASGASVTLVLSKADLAQPSDAETWIRRLCGWGYEPLPVSSPSGAGLLRLKERLSQPGIAVLCGPSGVGKSTLLNALLPDLQLRVASVSGRLQRGRHTTRHVELFPLVPGAMVADTPGFNRPELPSRLVQLAPLFPEVRQRLAVHGPCRFRDCLHRGEPGCSVGQDWQRWPLYSQCLDEIGQGGAGSIQERALDGRAAFPAQLRRSSRRTDRQVVRRDSDTASAAGG